MRILVTGGAGFIGKAVVAELVREADRVVVLDSLRPDVHRDGGGSSRARLAAIGADLVVGDVRDAPVVAAALRAVDLVVHLAAKVGLGVGVDDMADYVSSNDHGTSVLLRAMAARGVARFVQASSMVIYGEGGYTCDDHGPIVAGARTREALSRGRFEPPCPVCGSDVAPHLVREEAPMDPRNTYAATKVAQEHLGAIWARETGGSATSLRLHNVYGPGMPRNTPYAGVASIFSSALDRGEAPRVFEDGGQRRDFVHVNDVASAFATTMGVADNPSGQDQAGRHRAYNVGSGIVSTVRDLAQALSLSRSGPTPVVTGEYRLGDVRHITASSERIRDELGWRATVSLADGVSGLTFG
ncbi:MAG: NAD-dependent epimerase/dehydratase family protein [Dermatophilaceae bacterium]